MHPPEGLLLVHKRISHSFIMHRLIYYWNKTIIRKTVIWENNFHGFRICARAFALWPRTSIIRNRHPFLSNKGNITGWDHSFHVLKTSAEAYFMDERLLLWNKIWISNGSWTVLWPQNTSQTLQFYCTPHVYEMDVRIHYQEASTPYYVFWYINWFPWCFCQ